LATNTVRFLTRTSPATGEARHELMRGTLRLFLAEAEEVGLEDCFAALASDPDAPGTGRRLGWLRAWMRVCLYRAAYLTGRQFVESLRGGPGAAVASAGNDLPRHLWRELARDARVTLSYWLRDTPRYRAALCLCHELEESRSLTRRALGMPRRDRRALDTLLCRARQSFERYYRRLGELSSPPFPAVLYEALTGVRQVVLAETDKERALDSALTRLRRELR
jgi:hypothetical protein